MAAAWFYRDQITAFLSEDPLWEGAVRWSTRDGGNGHVYEVVVVSGAVDWTTANHRATAAGGYLATITSPHVFPASRWVRLLLFESNRQGIALTGKDTDKGKRPASLFSCLENSGGTLPEGTTAP